MALILYLHKVNNKFTNRRIIVNIKFTLDDFECNRVLNQMPFVFLPSTIFIALVLNNYV
jgi:hypothetical protein